MAVDGNVWAPDWGQRLRRRLHSMGYESVTQFLASHPGEPYVTLAEQLGNDVAGVQLGRMQIEEIRDEKEFRHVAMDAMVRELNANLPKGWQCISDPPLVEDEQTAWRHLAARSPILATLTEEATKQRIEFQASGAYAFWIVQLQFRDPAVESRADAVWNALKALSPPIGWRPSGPNDPIIVQAFEQGWPLSLQNTIGV